MFCPHCGVQIQGTDAKFCGSCGKALQQDNSPLNVTNPNKNSALENMLKKTSILAVKNGLQKNALFMAAGIVALMLMAGVGYFLFYESPAIKMVKSGKLHQCQKTVGQAANDFFGSPKWESGIGSEGEAKGLTLVNLRGKMLLHGKEVNAAMQFIVNKDEGSFRVNALEINDVPQNLFMTAAVISKMCEGE